MAQRGGLRLIGRGRDAGPASAGITDESDIRAAYNAHGAELYRFALRQLGDQGSAQDVVQETFLRAWRRADTYDPAMASLRVWLFSIARNVVIDEARRSAVRPWNVPVDPDPDRTGPVDPGVDEAVVDQWLVEEALRRISPEHRAAIIAVYLQGRPQAEVAAENDIPIGTLRSRVFYGLKALRLAMDEMGVAP